MSRYAIEIDRDLCTGYGVCIVDAPEHFELDDDGIAVALSPEAGPDAERELLAAARGCPMGAIRIVDHASGRAAA